MAKAVSMLEINKDYFVDFYKDLDGRFNLHKDYSYEYLVNFSQIKNEPIHRWFYYQEGYSPRLVENILEHLNLRKFRERKIPGEENSGDTLHNLELSMMSPEFQNSTQNSSSPEFTELPELQNSR